MSDALKFIARCARSDDVFALGRLGALLVALHHEYDSDRFIAPGPRTERGYGSFLASELERKDAIVLVAEERDAVLGYAYAGLEGKDWMTLRGPAGVIYDLVVDPARRREGSGRMLLHATLEALADRGAPRVVLSTATQKEVARRLVAIAGFRPTIIEMTRERSNCFGSARSRPSQGHLGGSPNISSIFNERRGLTGTATSFDVRR